MKLNIFQKFIRKAKNIAGIYNAPEGVVILMYHRINDELPDHNLITRTIEFEKQMKFLNDNPQTYQVIRMKDFEDNRDDVFNNRFPKTKVVITFDDGYLDNYQNAFPIMKKYEFPSTMFLTTGLIGTDKKFKRYDHLKGRDMLNWDEIQKMSQDGVSFGAHTVNHVHLPELDYKKQKEEITQSVQTLHSHQENGEKISTFCFPYGEYNEDSLKIIRDLKFQYAVTVVQGVNTPSTPLHELKRIEVSGMDSIKSFEYKVLEKYLT